MTHGPHSGIFAAATVIAVFLFGSNIAAAQALGPVVEAQRGAAYWMPHGDHSPPISMPTTALPDSAAPARPDAGQSTPIVNSAAVPTEHDTAFEVSPSQALTPLSVLKSCATNPASGQAPADVGGAVSATRIVVVTNSQIGIYNKTTCALISRVALKALFTSLGDLSTQVLFSARVIYDPHSSRFFVTALSRRTDPTNDEQYLYFAVSTNATATTFYPFRRLLFSAFCKDNSPSFIDYASPGVSDNRWFVTANYYPDPFSGSEPSGKIMDIEKTPTLTGSAPQARCTWNCTGDCAGNHIPLNIQPPIVQDGNATAYFAAARVAQPLILSGGGHADVVTGLALVKSFTGLAISDDTIEDLIVINLVLLFHESYLAHQPTVPPSTGSIAGQRRVANAGQRLAVLDGRFQSPSIQIGSFLFNVHTTEVNGQLRWRLYKISTSQKKVLFTFTPATVPGGVEHYNFNPSVAISGNTAFVTYSRTIPSDSINGQAAMLIAKGPASFATGWVSNLIGVSPRPFVKSGSTSCNNSDLGGCRWSRYSATQIDPSAPTTAWGFNELITNGALGGAGDDRNWSARAGRVN